MSRRTVVLLVALLLAVVAALAVWRYLSTVEDNVRADLQEVRVYRASALIAPDTPGAEAGDSIFASTALLEEVEFTGSTILCTGPIDPSAPGVDPNVCADNPSDLNTLLANAFAAGPISAGQLITTDMFVAASELDLDRLSAEIPDGTVAIAVSPGPIGSVGGQVVPGDNVNLVATFNLDISSVKALLADPETREFLLDTANLPAFLTAVGQPDVPTDDEEPAATDAPLDPLARFANALPEQVVFTQTIAQDLPVLAVGSRIVGAPPAEEDPAAQFEEPVVLQVLPDQAEVIELARQRATLSLVLLPDTYSEVEVRGATVDDVFDFVERLREQLETLNAS